MNMQFFYFKRWWGIVIKEFQELRRDKLSAGMLLIIPLIQIILFGYAINTDPHHLATAILDEDKSQFSRAMITAMKNSEYFNFTESFSTEQQAESAIKQGRVQFIVTFPADFTHNILRKKSAEMLVQADATDPATIANALATLKELPTNVIRQNLPNILQDADTQTNPFRIKIQRLYNPEGNTHYNVVPGLIGIVLTTTLVLMAGLSISRERENGTLESLLITPVRPIDVLLGKIAPYILIGFVQSLIICLICRYIFNVPIDGDIISLVLAILLFVIASLSVGISLSVFATNQLQSMQLAFFYFLPSVLLTGYMFPFRGMPEWAQAIGSVLPLTYFLRLIRGIMLKGNTIIAMWAEVWPLIVFSLIFLSIGLYFYRKTLD